MEDLKWIENWYLKNCDGNWEHSYGVEIGNIDNPGWYIKIDLKETYLKEKTNLSFMRKRGKMIGLDVGRKMKFFMGVEIHIS